MHKYVFFDIDSIELSPNGRTYVCHPNVSSNSEKLFDAYTLIAHIAAPLVFSVDVNRNAPNNISVRRDFQLIPASKNQREWEKSVSERYKFYIERETYNDKKGNAIFNNNQNVADFVKLLKANAWIVFGNGIEHNVDHVINKLLEIVGTVRYVPELIVPGKNETQDQLNNYFYKWEEQGVYPFTYNEIMALGTRKR